MKENNNAEITVGWGGGGGGGVGKQTDKKSIKTLRL